MSKIIWGIKINLKVKVLEKACPLIFLDDKIILFINKYTRLICYRDEKTKKDMEIIIIFKTKLNIDKILEDIEKSKIKEWLEKRKFFSDGPDELEIEEKKCKILLINKTLKLIMYKHFNRVSIKSNSNKKIAILKKGQKIRILINLTKFKIIIMEIL